MGDLTSDALKHSVIPDSFLLWPQDGNKGKAPEYHAPVSPNLHLDPKSEHYDVGGVSVLDVIKAKLSDANLSPYAGFLLGNIIKYSLRLPYKGTPARDADKINIYANKLIEELKDLDNPTE